MYQPARPRSLLSQALTLLNAHIAVVALLLIFDLVLATRLLVAWHDSRSDHSAQYNADLATYAQLQSQAAHLQALPARLASSRRQADAFVSARVPLTDSEVISELGALSTRDHVRLSRASYTPAPAIPGMVELRIEASVSGEYTPIMHFINDMERDKDHAFFIIRSITLTGEQGGLVSLRLRLTTYMRVDAANAALLEPANRESGAAGESTRESTGEVQ